MGSCWYPGAGEGRLHVCVLSATPNSEKCVGTYAALTAVAFRVLVLLMFLACSLTLDFASSMEPLELATDERARVNCAGMATFETDGTRILEADRDILASDGSEGGRRTKHSPGKTGEPDPVKSSL